MPYIIADEIKATKEPGDSIEINILKRLDVNPKDLHWCLIAIPNTHFSFELYRIERCWDSWIYCTPLSSDAFIPEPIPNWTILEYGYPTTKKEPKEIWYRDIKDLGFKEKEVKDEIYEDQYGYPYKIFELKLSKKYYLVWKQSSGKCELVRHKKNWIKKRIPITDLEHLKTVIEHYRAQSEGR